jgi:sugar phosphate isomerase/epimerase
MILGYSTNAFVNFSLEDSIEKIAAMGFAGVEIMGDRPHLYPPDYDEAAVRRIGELLTRHRLKVTNINSFTLFAVGDTYLPSWIDADPAKRQIRIDHTLDCLRVAAALGCTNISVPPGGPPEGIDRADAMARFVAGIEAVLPEAERLGVRILVEPEPDLLIEDTPGFLEFLKAVRSDAVGINFDIGHFFCAGEDPAQAFETLFDRVGHVHLEDIAASRVHRHLICGHGAIDLPEVFRTMKRLGYAGDISLELYPYVDAPEAAGKESLDFLQPLFEETGIDPGLRR